MQTFVYELAYSATALATWRWSALSNPHSGIKWRIEIDKIDTCVGKLFRVPQPLQIVAEIQPIHSVEMFIAKSASAPLASLNAHSGSSASSRCSRAVINLYCTMLT